MGDAAIRLEDVSLAFGAVRALDGVTCEIPAGVVAGVAGPDGAGKTTLLRVAVGLLRPQRGRVAVLGHDLPGDLAAVRAEVGYLPQRLGLLGHLTVRENLEYFGDLNGVPRAALREQTARLLGITGLEPFGARLAQHLSGGMREKLALACAILHRPRLVLLDEPSTGLDPLSRRDMWELIYGLLGEGRNVVVATPSWEEAARCQWLVVLDGGRVLTAGEPTALAAQAERLVWEMAAPPGAEDALAAADGVVSVRRHGPMLRAILRPDLRDEAAARRLLDAALPGSGPRPVAPTLEDSMTLATRRAAS
jgi:ABC-2 type transport system ATP-binding protein